MDQITRKHRFLEALGIVIIVVALVKCGVSGTGGEDNKPDRPDMESPAPLAPPSDLPVFM